MNLIVDFNQLQKNMYIIINYSQMYQTIVG